MVMETLSSSLKCNFLQSYGLIYYFMTKEMKFDTRCETFAMM
jgi:hypothetical protein